MMNRILHENFDDEREEYDTGNVIDKQHCMWQLHDYYTMVLPPIQHQFIAVFFAYVALVCRFGSTNIDKNFGEQESSCAIMVEKDIATYIKQIHFMLH